MLKNKYIFIFAALALVAIFGVNVGAAKAQADQGERIISFSSNLEPRTDASMKLTETIVYDFGSLERHGIFRILRSQNADNKNIEVRVLGVTDEKNSPYNFTLAENANVVTVKIGDADKTITGVHTYVISYEVSNVATYFDDHDEFTWNVMGDKWNIPVLSSDAKVVLPADADGALIDEKNITYFCYKGLYGSTTACAEKKLEDGVVTFSDKDFDSAEDMTISVGLPKGIIIPTKEPFDYAIFAWLLPLLALVGIFSASTKKKREIGNTTTIIPQYEQPEGMAPTLTGAIVDGRVDNRDITAGLISAAEQGFVKITRIDKKWFLGDNDYELTLLRPIAELPEETERKILGYFLEDKNVGDTVALSNLSKTKFPQMIAKLKSGVYKEMAAKKYFSKNPQTRMAIMIALGVFILFIGVMLGIVLGLHVILAMILTGVLCIIYPFVVSIRTKLGAETRRHILGFKHFLSVTDKGRFDFHNAPDKKPEQFMKYLPFAIALGVENKWADQFKDIYITPPNWYAGSQVGNFTALSFVHDMSAFTAYSNSIATPKSSGGGFSDGGGFSGGGGGGGGGGSW